MKVPGIVLSSALALAACQKDPSAAAREAQRGAPPAQPSAPNPAAGPRYIGRWAASKDLCQAGAWNFAERRLETAGEVACDFERVAEVPGGYDVHAVCTAEAPPKPYDIRLRFAQSARALLVEGGPFHDVGLIWCGPGEGPF